MADRMKGITIVIDGDTTKFQKSLSDANKQIKDTQTQLRDVEKLLKVDPKNIELLTQRQKLLTQQVEETRKKLNLLKEAEAQAQEQFRKGEISEQQYDALKREIIATENELSRLEKAARESNATLAHVGAVAKEVSDKTGDLADKTKGLSTAAAGVVVALGGIALNAVKSADDLNTMAKQTGFSTEELQKMSYAADLVDVSLDDITGAAAKLKRGMASSSKDTQAAFAQLGVSVRNANGQLRNSTDVFYDVISALGNVSDETERDVLAMQLFGKSADSLAGIIDDGGAALRQYGQDAKRMGLILSQDTLNGLNKVNDRLDTLKGQMKGVLAQNGAKVIEAFLPLIEDVAGWVGNLAEKIASLDSEQVKTIATIAAVVAGISPALSLVSKISGAIAALMPILSSLNAVLLANPAAAVAVGIGALTAAVVALGAAAKNQKSPVDGLTAAAKNLGNGIDEANKAYETQITDIEITNEKAKIYLDRLKKLSEKLHPTAEEQWEYTKAVEALNELYPDLNLKIDENTGRLTDNVYQIEQQIEALKKAAIQQALQAKYQGILDAMAAAQVEVYENQAKLNKIQSENGDYLRRYNAVYDNYIRQAEKLAGITDTNSDAWKQQNAIVQQAALHLKEVEQEHPGLIAEVKDLTKAIEVGKGQVQKYADEYESAVSGISSILAEEGKNAGAAWGEGMARGIKSKLDRIRAVSSEAAKVPPDEARRFLQWNSPSKVAMKVGRDWDEGLVLGMKQGQGAVEDTSAEVAQSMIPVQNYSTTNTTNHNVGGISVTVNAAQGQDVQQIAEAVMEEIQMAVEREGAAL